MATIQGSGIPTVKVEGLPEQTVKSEPRDDSPSPYMDVDDDDVYEEAGDLDFSQVTRQLWLSHIPKGLYDALSKLGDDEEIEIGTIRVEGPESNATRVSLLLSNQIPQLESHPKEYILSAPPVEKQRLKRPGQALIFSEKDLPGYKAKTFAWDDLDEDGNPGQGRSYLYERQKKEQRRKENKGRFTPYTRKPIPKQTAITGTVAKEFDVVPVKNQEYFVLENRKAQELLKVPEKRQAVLATGDEDPSKRHVPFMSMSDRAAAMRNAQARKQAQKETRAARVDKSVLIDKLLELFKLHRIWGLRDLKARVNQPEAYLRSTLDEIAFMWKAGDFNGKWELKDEYKANDEMLMKAETVAPKAEDSDLDKSALEDDEGEGFEDVDFEG